MKILSAEQIREWDAITIKHQNSTSLELMEKAATACYNFIANTNLKGDILIFCGPGNNGGDGFALARILHENNYKVTVIEVWNKNASISPDNKINRDKLSKNIEVLSFENFYKHPIDTNRTIIIDAILGLGQNRALSGNIKLAVEWINQFGKNIISIDIPTGLFEVCHKPENVAVEAKITLSFGSPKLPFFFPENDRFIGKWEVLDIGLDEGFPETIQTTFNYLSQKDIETSKIKRRKFSHKGTFGTAYLFAGQTGMAGAAILASKACLRSGVGKLIVRIPKDCLNILQSIVPEAICDVDPHEEVLSTFPSDLTPYQSVGIGPGIGRSPLTKALIWKLLRNGVPNLVLDADAINIIAEEGWQNRIPPGTVVTPHLREFERLWGTSENHYQRLMKAAEIAIENRLVIVVKGAHTAIIGPDGSIFFNTTGNTGLAKAGTGDVLTGMIVGILAQGYEVTEGVKRAVFLHGLAAEILSEQRTPESFLASDLVNCIGISKL